MNIDQPKKGVLLVIEDHESAQIAYKSQIEPLVKKLLIVKDAKTTLNIMNEYGSTVDLILLNIRLPDMNGFKLGEILRKQGIKAPIIAISSSYFRIEVQTAYHNIFNEFFVKPLMQKQIKKLLDKYL
jgi:two-component system capsular synthesis sensor histidine kinase RcsC